MKKKKTVTFIGGYDDKPYTVTPAHGTIAIWKRGLCWNAVCANPIFFIHLSVSGNATHGYCTHGHSMDLYKYWPRGNWYMLIKGKLKLLKRPLTPVKGE